MAPLIPIRVPRSGHEVATRREARRQAARVADERQVQEIGLGVLALICTLWLSLGMASGF